MMEQLFIFYRCSGRGIALRTGSNLIKFNMKVNKRIQETTLRGESAKQKRPLNCNILFKKNSESFVVSSN